jgi:hypothetical protein
MSSAFETDGAGLQLESSRRHYIICLLSQEGIQNLIEEPSLNSKPAARFLARIARA